MEIPDLPRQQRRLDGVAERLYADDGILAPLAERYQVRTFGFNTRLRRISGADDLGATGMPHDLTWH
jgi:hypothetical protein